MAAPAASATVRHRRAGTGATAAAAVACIDVTRAVRRSGRWLAAGRGRSSAPRPHAGSPSSQWRALASERTLTETTPMTDDTGNVLRLVNRTVGRALGGSFISLHTSEYIYIYIYTTHTRYYIDHRMRGALFSTAGRVTGRAPLSRPDRRMVLIRARERACSPQPGALGACQRGGRRVTYISCCPGCLCTVARPPGRGRA